MTSNLLFTLTARRGDSFIEVQVFDEMEDFVIDDDNNLIKVPLGLYRNIIKDYKDREIDEQLFALGMVLVLIKHLDEEEEKGK